MTTVRDVFLAPVRFLLRLVKLIGVALLVIGWLLIVMVSTHGL